MSKVIFPYGRNPLMAEIDDDRIAAVLTTYGLTGTDKEEAVVLETLHNPIFSLPLSELAMGKRRITVVTSDHTRALPSKITLRAILDEIRKGNNRAEITILVASGTHRPPADEELKDKFGKDLLERERFVIHRGGDPGTLREIGRLPSGNLLEINRIAAESDLLVAEGTVNQHVFAGFSGGPKSILPGISGHKTILRNHSGRNLASPRSRPGILAGNPAHEEMESAAEMARLAFSLNVVLGEDGKIAAAFAGDWRSAHASAVKFLTDRIKVPAVVSPLTVTSSGGYPHDQSLYQAIKGMVTAEATTIPGGCIIVAAECRDSYGTDVFHEFLGGASTLEEFCRWADSLPPDETPNGLWMAQVIGRIMSRYRLVLVSQGIPSDHGLPGLTVRWPLTEAIAASLAALGPGAKATIIPDGAKVLPVAV